MVPGLTLRGKKLSRLYSSNVREVMLCLPVIFKGKEFLFDLLGDLSKSSDVR